MASELKSSSNNSQQQIQPYQQVDGLLAIYIGTGKQIAASFLFETAEKAKKAYEGVRSNISTANALGYGKEYTDLTKTDLLEVLVGQNLSTERDQTRVVSVVAKTMGTVGKPMETIHQLLYRMGVAMKIFASTETINAVPIYAVDSHVHAN